jgi:hypothetical protein
MKPIHRVSMGKRIVSPSARRGYLQKMCPPNTDVTASAIYKCHWGRAAGGRGAPGIAQRPTGARCTAFETAPRPARATSRASVDTTAAHGLPEIVEFRNTGDAWAGTTTVHGRLMLTVLGGLAEFERDLNRARISEGRQRAKARGVRR